MPTLARPNPRGDGELAQRFELPFDDEQAARAPGASERSRPAPSSPVDLHLPMLAGNPPDVT